MERAAPVLLTCRLHNGFPCRPNPTGDELDPDPLPFQKKMARAFTRFPNVLPIFTTCSHTTGCCIPCVQQPVPCPWAAPPCSFPSLLTPHKKRTRVATLKICSKPPAPNPDPLQPALASHPLICAMSWRRKKFGGCQQRQKAPPPPIPSGTGTELRQVRLEPSGAPHVTSCSPTPSMHATFWLGYFLLLSGPFVEALGSPLTDHRKKTNMI